MPYRIFTYLLFNQELTQCKIEGV